MIIIKLWPLNEEKPSINISQEVEFPVIESYAILENENEDNNIIKNNNLNTNNNKKKNDNFDKNNLIYINEEEENEKAVRNFNDFVDKILKEF